MVGNGRWEEEADGQFGGCVGSAVNTTMFNILVSEFDIICQLLL